MERILIPYPFLPFLVPRLVVDASRDARGARSRGAIASGKSSLSFFIVKKEEGSSGNGGHPYKKAHSRALPFVRTLCGLTSSSSRATVWQED
jgi:hypothetical protein